MKKLIFFLSVFGVALNFSNAQSSSVYVHSYSSSNNNSSVNVQVNCVNGVCNTTKTVTGDPANTVAEVIIATSSPAISNYINQNVQKNISNISTRINTINLNNKNKITKVNQPQKIATTTTTINTNMNTISGSVSGGVNPTVTQPNFYGLIKARIDLILARFLGI